jgi:hypothetical protein
VPQVVCTVVLKVPDSSEQEWAPNICDHVQHCAQLAVASRLSSGSEGSPQQPSMSMAQLAPCIMSGTAKLPTGLPCIGKLKATCQPGVGFPYHSLHAIRIHKLV